MKQRTLNFIMILTILFINCFVLTSCSSYGGSKEPGDYGGLGYAGGEFGETFPDTNPDEGNNSQIVIKPGQLTACAYDDNEHFSFWKSLVSQYAQTNESNGLFQNYYEIFEFKTYNRLIIKVPTNVDAKVHLVDDQKNVLATSIPNANGIAYLYPTVARSVYNICLEYVKTGETEITTQYEEIQGDTEFVIDGETFKNDVIQLMFVIDTTGSMGDEIRYLKSEIKNVIENVNIDQNNVRLGLLFYRDEGDSYVTKLSDFTTDIAYQIDFISNQSANGGGDYPEAVDQALNEAINKASWSSNGTESTKILIHVLDAPPHYTKTNLQLFSKSIISAAEKGIRIIPVASSGINKWTEFLLRTEALMTGGTYTYITNDSGIGGGHIDATVPEKVVEYLNAMLIRLINEYHTGVIKEPIPYNQKQDK